MLYFFDESAVVLELMYPVMWADMHLFIIVWPLPDNRQRTQIAWNERVIELLLLQLLKH